MEFSEATANPAAPDRPAGLLNGITPLTPAAAGEKSQILVDDLQTIASAIAPVAGNGEIVLVAAPAQAVAIQLRLPSAVTWPVLTSAGLPPKTVIAVAVNGLVSAIDGAPAIDASQEAEIHRESVPETSMRPILRASLESELADRLTTMLRDKIKW
jgi:hypothetical protein